MKSLISDQKIILYLPIDNILEMIVAALAAMAFRKPLFMLYGAVVSPYHWCFLAKVTELLEIQEGLQLAWEAGYGSLVVETDAKIAINNIVSSNEALGLCNIVADRLAKLALGSVSTDVWL
ncbi:unnamed protein product [Prunus armeniaca]|uniref:RNase H type-1 domain-containing protein n=1 Tax=Prunus armeniaca TaxID=36596 RepID=A0A6J5V748_PRUAR|nr:unnamed protein product [Prunus armeniaca]